MKMIFEKSIVSSRNLKKGTILLRKDLSFKKPGTGISAKDYKKIIGLKIKKNLKKDQIIRFDFFH
jgi:sialic acid synthase SpsE